MTKTNHQRRVKLSSILRDFIINALPIKELPSALIDILYGRKTDFIFLVHPRHKKDIYNTAPFIKLISRLIPERILLKFLALCPAYVVSKAEWPAGNVQGLIISTTRMPEELLTKRTDTLSELNKIVKFIRKVTHGKVYVGLAAWWPIVTNSGLAFQRVLEDNDRIVITNGHTATLVSIFLMINKLCKIASSRLNSVKILIIGIGKMGSAVAEILSDKVKDIGIIDRNEVRMRILEKCLMNKNPFLKVKKYLATATLFSDKIFSILSEYDIAICTTSNINYIINDTSKLRNCIILDDSRPEAFPRVIDSRNNIAVLEGGILKFAGLKMDTDFGFGSEHNVFGCMAEAIILAQDGMKQLKPIIGEIDYDNFTKMVEYCKEHSIEVGDFISGYNVATLEFLQSIFKKKHSSNPEPV